MAVRQEKDNLISFAARQCKLTGFSKALIILVCLDNLTECGGSGSGMGTLAICRAMPGNGFNQPCLALCRFNQAGSFFFESGILKQPDRSSGHRKYDTDHDQYQVQKPGSKPQRTLSHDFFPLEGSSSPN